MKPEYLQRAHCWGLAMRLGQRLSGGVSSVLERTSLSRSGTALRLTVPRAEERSPAMPSGGGFSASPSPSISNPRSLRNSSRPAGVAFRGGPR